LRGISTTITLTYIVIGLLISVGITAISTRFSKTVRLALGASVIVLCILTGVLSTGVSYLGAEHWYDDSPTKELILFGLMMLGMTASTLSQAIEERRRARQKRLGQGVSLQIDVWDFVYPFLVSFITFGAIMAQIGSGRCLYRE
jgi:cell division protein FtsW (lipid II flippase)